MTNEQRNIAAGYVASYAPGFGNDRDQICEIADNIRDSLTGIALQLICNNERGILKRLGHVKFQLEVLQRVAENFATKTAETCEAYKRASAND